MTMNVHMHNKQSLTHLVAMTLPPAYSSCPQYLAAVAAFVPDAQLHQMSQHDAQDYEQGWNVQTYRAAQMTAELVVV